MRLSALTTEQRECPSASTTEHIACSDSIGSCDWCLGGVVHLGLPHVLACQSHHVSVWGCDHIVRITASSRSTCARALTRHWCLIPNFELCLEVWVQWVEEHAIVYLLCLLLEIEQVGLYQANMLTSGARRQELLHATIDEPPQTARRRDIGVSELPEVSYGQPVQLRDEMHLPSEHCRQG
jgi:hypothetical protein